MSFFLFPHKLQCFKETRAEIRQVRPNLAHSRFFGGHIRARLEKLRAGVPQIQKFSACSREKGVHLVVPLCENFGHV